ncbi:hypothetical protein [Sphingopyxis sp. 113P3]|uniref:hypothetical protein n=1 Tax=Sphingopyxis sp. (strain 113P3) TaxID=292913 RepID=UPI0006BD7CD8|nr:hypothetical protein [Sphingopyxis sp. 113P3]ALC12521.1 hypothetical protein LH20_11215 [Sphingopyxis sp. 113P3]
MTDTVTRLIAGHAVTGSYCQPGGFWTTFCRCEETFDGPTKDASLDAWAEHVAARADGGSATPMREAASSVGADALAHLESEARRFAGFYKPNSDMANTLNILGNKIAALAAISTAQVDETERVTVPREPTEAMYLAAFNSDLWGGRQPIRRVVDEIWDAMLRAALAPEGDAR